jgi:L-asparaginase
MTYKTVKLTTSSNQSAESSILMIYTGGTLGMVYAPEDGHLVPFDFEHILERMPEINRLKFELTVVTFHELIDSSDMKPANWTNMARLIYQNYHNYDSFVIIHGTDTMAYSASALSFMLENLSKPVILTGAQLPIGAARTDARENLITALEIASAKLYSEPRVPELCVYFNSHLLRGNRAKKIESAHFNAFHSENYPQLAHAGIRIDYNTPFIRAYQPERPLLLHPHMDENVTLLKLFPGISKQVVKSVLSIPDLKGVVLETYGSGNAPTEKWFLHYLEEAVERNIVIFNVSQCAGGRVTQGRYQSSKILQEIGVVSGSDITSEAAITKLMHLLAKESNPESVRWQLGRNICGEMS